MFCVLINTWCLQSFKISTTLDMELQLLWFYLYFSNDLGCPSFLNALFPFYNFINVAVQSFCPVLKIRLMCCYCIITFIFMHWIWIIIRHKFGSLFLIVSFGKKKVLILMKSNSLNFFIYGLCFRALTNLSLYQSNKFFPCAFQFFLGNA